MAYPVFSLPMRLSELHVGCLYLRSRRTRPRESQIGGTNRTKVQWTKVQLFCAVQSAKNSDSEEDMDYRHRKYGIVFYN